MGFFMQGLTLGLAYVAPIGMQNLFVIDSALTQTHRRALFTALIVLMFDIALSLSCFFGIGGIMQRYDWLRLGVLAVGGLIVIRIGIGLLIPDGTSKPAEESEQSQGMPRRRPGRGDGGLLDVVVTAGVVTWLNPQAIIDGTLMLGAFSATLTAPQAMPFISGVGMASALWFIGLTLLVCALSRRFSPKVVVGMNRVCGVVMMLYGVKLLVDFGLAVL